MDSGIKVTSLKTLPIFPSPKLNTNCNSNRVSGYGFRFGGSKSTMKAYAINGSVSASASHEEESNSVCAARRRMSSLESLFSYDKAVPEEKIEKPIGTALSEKVIGNNLRCNGCQAKGAVLCPTCSGSGLYIDAILESQGIIVKIRCLGCGGTGNTMCNECGGRGHLGQK